MLEGATARRVFDVGLAALIAAVGVAEIWLPFPSVLGEGSKSLSTLVVVLVSGVLVFRRTWPLGTAVLALITWPLVFTITPVLVLFWGQFVPMAVAVFSVARHGRGKGTGVRRSRRRGRAAVHGSSCRGAPGRQ